MCVCVYLQTITQKAIYRSTVNLSFITKSSSEKDKFQFTHTMTSDTFFVQKALRFFGQNFGQNASHSTHPALLQRSERDDWFFPPVPYVKSSPFCPQSCTQQHADEPFTFISHWYQSLFSEEPTLFTSALLTSIFLLDSLWLTAD